MRWARAFLTLVALAAASCSVEEAKNPFVREDAGVDADVEADADAEPGDAGDSDPEPGLGGPCLDDGQCDDGIDCTADRCDPELKRCRFTPDDSLCQDGVYCNGNEVCDLRLGCRPGEPVTCSDQNACTIERCVEETRSCERYARDADGDGDPDHHCGGGDCDDDDPLVSSNRPEICGNGRDDDCDGKVDEDDDTCVVPDHDRCDDAFVIDAPGNYALSLFAALPDYAASCAPTSPSVRDVVATIRLPQGPARDIDVVATTPSSSVAIAMPERCGEPGTELGCHGATRGANGNAMARIRARTLEPGSYPLYVFTEADAEVTLRVRFLDPAPKPENETCGTAAVLAPFTQVSATVIDAERDVGSACSAELGDLVYTFTLAETSDVRLRATSEDGLGDAVLSLRSEACALPEDEITCVSGNPAVLFQRSLPAGTYFVAVSATAPTDLKLVLEVFPPTEAPADEICEGAPALPHNTTVTVDLTDHTDDVRTGCSTGFADAAYSLVIDEPSDVLLVQRFAQGEHGAVQLSTPACATPEDRLACGIATQSPARASVRKLPPGEYRAIVESRHASEVTLTAFVRPYAPPTLVAFADRCEDAVVVPRHGGFFQGNTANATSDYSAGCDYGGGMPAPDQMLRLDLDERKRVVLDMNGSGYQTLLNVRRGPECPGTEVVDACDIGASASRSFLDRILEPGTYWIQIDGFAGGAGPWFLDVRIVDP